MIIKATPLAHERLASIGRHLQARHDHAKQATPRIAQQAERGIVPLRRLLDETITTMRMSPVEVFPASLDSVSHIPIKVFEITDDA